MKQTNFIYYSLGTKSMCWKVTPGILFGLVFLNLFIISCAFYIGTQQNPDYKVQAKDIFPEVQDTLAQQDITIKLAKDNAEKSIDILAAKLGTLQYQVIRLNALGQRLSATYNIDEIDFSDDSLAIGGRKSQLQSSLTVNDFVSELEELEIIIKNNSEQISALTTLLSGKSITDNRHPSIMPIKAYVSSWFGWRSDPMKKHNRKSFHQGIDFSADVGTSIKSVADGIVSWSGPKDQYGNFIEIDHGNGYVTRYGHIDELYVRVGQRVSKGQQIASVGMTGRSTGPHLHFEIQKNGEHLDPKNFMKFN